MKTRSPSPSLAPLLAGSTGPRRARPSRATSPSTRRSSPSATCSTMPAPSPRPASSCAPAPGHHRHRRRSPTSSALPPWSVSPTSRTSASPASASSAPRPWSMPRCSTRLIDADLARRGIIVRRRHRRAPLRCRRRQLSTPRPSPIPASLVSLRYTPGNGAFSARFTIAGIDQPVDLSGSIELMTTAPRLAATLPAGTILTQSRFRDAPSVPLATADAGGYADLDQLIGKQLVRQTRGGIMLKATDVADAQGRDAQHARHRPPASPAR